MPRSALIAQWLGSRAEGQRRLAFPSHLLDREWKINALVLEKGIHLLAVQIPNCSQRRARSGGQ